MRDTVNINSDLIQHFSIIEDPRIDRTKRHLLIDIIVIAICSIICNGEGWEDMEIFGKSRYEWFKQFLELPNGIPSADTFRRVFERIDAATFKRCFLAWIESVTTKTDGDIIAIDGKTLRRSFDKGIGKCAIHMVSAWSTANQMVIGQVKTDEKSNEIKAIPKLLEILALKGCIVTIDAMGCQKDIVEKIKQKKGDYVIALKGNQSSLHDDVKLYLDDQIEVNPKKSAYYETIEKDHGRIETRRYWITSKIEWLKERHSGWSGLKSIGVVEAIREINGKQTKDRRYYIASIGANAREFEKAVRRHWSIENSLHWVLDIVFREDESRIRSKNGAQNLALFRHLAINLLKQETTFKRSIRKKRYRASIEPYYFEQVLGFHT